MSANEAGPSSTAAPGAAPGAARRPLVMGTQNDGVFANMAAKPDAVTGKTYEDIEPPSYSEAVAVPDPLLPGYLDTSITGVTEDGEVLIDGFPVGDSIAFVVNLFVSTTFDILGFLLTSLLATSHAAKCGSQFGLGLTMIRLGLFVRSKDDDGSGDLPPADNSGYTPDPAEEQQRREWSAFLLLVIGMFVCLRAVAEYVRVRRMRAIIMASSSSSGSIFPVVLPAAALRSPASRVPPAAFKAVWALLPADQPADHQPADSLATAVADLLDLGAEKVLVDLRSAPSAAAAEALLAGLDALPADRLAVWVHAALLEPAAGPALLARLASLASLVAVHTADSTNVAALPLTAIPRSTVVALSGPLAAARAPFALLVDHSLLALDTPTADAPIDLASAVASQLKTDRADGLLPTIVADEHGVALGLCYSSRESIRAALVSGTGVYMSRNRGLWHKGATSGATQQLHRIDWDCDGDTLRFTVSQAPPGFCHLDTRTCFGPDRGRLFEDPALLRAKILEEAEELCDASDKEEIAWEAADLLYFALAKCVAEGVSLADVERHLDARAKKVSRRAGNAKPKFVAAAAAAAPVAPAPVSVTAAAPVQTADSLPPVEPFTMRQYTKSSMDATQLGGLLQRPIINTSEIMSRVKPIVEAVRTRGDAALVELTAKFDRVTLAEDDVVERAPFDAAKMVIDPAVKDAIDLAYDNIWKFHAAQLETEPLVVETMAGITCSRVVRPIERVGLYVPGGTAVLPSSTLMLGVPAKVAGCAEIVIATPPRADGTIAPEIMYVAAKAGGAQAVAAMAYGTARVPKVDKICGPGNQYVTAAKMVAQSDASALLSIDMPAGPSELLVIADTAADPRYVVADLLSQAEHGTDSQVVLVTVGYNAAQHAAVQAEVRRQATALPRSAIVRESLAKSYILAVDTMADALAFSNAYAPEHLILNVVNAGSHMPAVASAGSVFLGPWSPESCGDYASGTNHTLPTYGYARMYSGVNTGTFVKHITTQELSSEGLDAIGDCVTTLAALEQLEAHRNAVAIRLLDIRRKL
ncbi:histidinol dehydrogenase-domain-containing protein [Entophlyctis helioformis]|nr:histidinol dehydrogenase-domain-containing protein [Entophlyctis helioformis]